MHVVVVHCDLTVGYLWPPSPPYCGGTPHSAPSLGSGLYHKSRILLLPSVQWNMNNSRVIPRVLVGGEPGYEARLYPPKALGNQELESLSLQAMKLPSLLPLLGHVSPQHSSCLQWGAGTRVKRPVAVRHFEGLQALLYSVQGACLDRSAGYRVVLLLNLRFPGPIYSTGRHYFDFSRVKSNF